MRVDESPIYGRWRLPGVSRVVQTVVAAGVALSFASLPAAAIGAAVTGSSPAVLLVLPVMLPIVYLAGRGTINLWRAQVTITGRAVVVAGVMKTHRVPLDEVDRFFAADMGDQPTILLRRRHGRDLPLSVFNRNGFIWSFRRLLAGLEPVAEQLNACVAAARAEA
jgi:hypothetical protein